MLSAIQAYLKLSLDEIYHHPQLLINAFDQQHRILIWNKWCEQFFGISTNDAVGHLLEDVIPYAKGNEKMIHLRRALAGQEIHILNSRFDKSSEFYDQRVIPIKGTDGKTIAALNIVTIKMG